MHIVVVPEKPTKSLNFLFSREKVVVEFANNPRKESWQKIKPKITKAKANLFQLPLELIAWLHFQALFKLKRYAIGKHSYI